MEMKLCALEEPKTAKKRTRPVDYFKKCPKCGEKELIKLDPDVLCSSCDWDSLAWDVSRGAMDNITQAAKEAFVFSKPTPEPKKENPPTNSKNNNQTKIGA